MHTALAVIKCLNSQTYWVFFITFLGNVASEYKEFSEWYLKTFSQAILTSILRVLVVYQSGVYVSPRVMQLALNYVNTGVSHALTWKLIKPHILVSKFFNQGSHGSLVSMILL